MTNVTILGPTPLFSDGTPVPGEQFGCSFDDIGNRTAISAGGDQWGANLRYASYSANNLNQYTSRTVPGAVDVIGEATNAATVTVNNQTTYRHGTFYRDQLALSNSIAPVWQSVTNLAVLNQGTNADVISTNIGNIFLPQTPERFTYDADGNLTSDGRWTNTWDGENRLISMTSLTNGPTGSKLRLAFGYDYKSRRISKTVSNWTGTAWAFTTNLTFAYDGWNLIATLNSQSSILQTFTWGIDLSGSMQGAGGVGGLLKESYVGTTTTNCFLTFDGNGNVVALVNVVDGTLLAKYEYGPFGEVNRASGSLAKANPFRFSTKYHDDENGLLYYGYRYYSASMGRWFNRDPFGELGGIALYGFCGNNPVTRFDRDGKIWTDLIDVVKDAVAEATLGWLQWLLTHHTYITRIEGVTCPIGSTSTLVEESVTTRSRSLDVTIHVASYTFHQSLGDATYFNFTIKTYKCCKCEGFSTSNTLYWHYKDLSSSESVDSGLNFDYNSPVGSVEVISQATDTTTKTDRWRDCTEEVPPLSRYTGNE